MPRPGRKKGPIGMPGHPLCKAGCCCTVRTGSLALGSFDVVARLLLFVLSETTWSRQYGPFRPRDNDKIAQMGYNYTMWARVDSSLVVFTSIVMMFGMLHSKWYFILPYLGYMLFQALVNVTLSIYLSTCFGAFSLMIWCVTCIEMYTWVVVFSEWMRRTSKTMILLDYNKRRAEEHPS